MKQATYVSVRLAFVLWLLACPLPSTALTGNEESTLQEARAAVTKALARPGSAPSFEGLKLVRDNLGTVVCGTANGKRFLVGPAGKPPPQIEGALSAAMFNYLWNARCRGMPASDAEEAFRRELR